MVTSNRSALLKLRNAMLFITIGSVILFFGVLAILGYSNQVKGHISSASPIVALLLLLVGGIMALLGTLDVYGGFTIMEYIGKVYDTGKYGALAQFVASMLLTIGFYLLVFSNSASVQFIGSGFTLTGYVIGIICALPVGMAFRNLGEKYRESIIKLGAVVYILIPIIGPLILYFGLKKITAE